MKYNEVFQLAHKINKSITSFNDSVLIIHYDGSIMFFRYAVVLKCHLWLLVFTEHQGLQIFHINDLSGYKKFKSINNKIDPIDDNGNVISEISCSICSKIVSVLDSHSLYDKLGNCEDKEICDNCFNEE